MFIFWGKKVVFRKLGYVADFCPMCRVARAFELQRVGVVGHVYYISFCEGALAGYQNKCLECDTALEARPTAYAAISDELGSVAALTAKTFPTLLQTYQAVMALDERARTAPASLSSEGRHALIRTPMLLLSAKVEKHNATTHLDREVGYAVLVWIGVLLAAPPLYRLVAGDALELGELWILGIGLVGVVWQIAAERGRFMRRKIVPALARSLKPLAPTEAEVRAVLTELSRLRHKIGTKLKADTLMAALA